MNTIGGDGSVVETDKDVKEFLFGSLDLPLANLETSLKNYVRRYTKFLFCYDFICYLITMYNCLLSMQEPSEEPFDVSSVPREVKSQPFAEKKAAAKKAAGLGAPPVGPTSTVDTYEKLLLSIPEFSTFGRLFKVFIA